MGDSDTGQPPPGGGVPVPGHLNSSTGSTNMTSAWAGGAGAAGQSRKQRSFAEIISELILARTSVLMK